MTGQTLCHLSTSEPMQEVPFPPSPIGMAVLLLFAHSRGSLWIFHHLDPRRLQHALAQPPMAQPLQNPF